MTPLGIFVTFVLPIGVVALGWALVWLEGLADRPDRQSHPAQ